MMASYVMSDLHGRYPEYMAMLKKIAFSRGDRLYILGDVLNRGYGERLIFKDIMERNNISFIMGNHELDLLKRVETRQGLSGRKGSRLFKRLSSRDPVFARDLLAYLKKASYWAVVDRYVLVHAGVKNPEKLAHYKNIEAFMTNQKPLDLVWKSEQFYRQKGLEGYTVIFGHTPTCLMRHECGQIWFEEKWQDKIGIDCGVFLPQHNGRLGCLRLEDRQVFYVSHFEAKYQSGGETVHRTP